MTETTYRSAGSALLTTRQQNAPCVIAPYALPLKMAVSPKCQFREQSILRIYAVKVWFQNGAGGRIFVGTFGPFGPIIVSST